MNRQELDALLAPHQLSAPVIERALALTQNRPTADAWRSFAVRSLGLVGMAGIGTGLIFFVAANWQIMSVLQRFALVEIILLLCLGVAWWKYASPNILSAALILCTLVSGALLALFGQTYQTGADVYELFFFWALLTLPFALAAMSGALWAVWAGIFNVGLALYTGWHGPGDFIWDVFDRWGIHKTTLLMLPFILNFAAAALVYRASMTRYAAAAPIWLVRLLLTIAFAYGTSAILPRYSWSTSQAVLQGQDFAMAAIFAVACAALVLFALRQKRDVFPLALVAASFMLISTVFIGSHMKDFGGVIIIALWLIAASTTVGFVLMGYVKAWRSEEPTTKGAAV